MGTRVRLGKGFTYGRSGLRWGHGIPGVPRGYASVGRSGTLITGGPLRHWEPARRTPVGAARCQGTTQTGNQCRNAATLGVTCRLHESQAGELTTAPAGTHRFQVRRYLPLILMVGLIVGFFAAWARIDAGYARTHDSQGQPAGRAGTAPVDCATDPLAPYLYSCTEHPAVPDLTYRHPHHG